jgi:hypothetical protein
MLEEALTNIADINDRLPNGLHDAEIEIMTEDIRASSLSLQLMVWVGTMDDPPSLRERYRRGRLLFEQVHLFAVTHPRHPDADHSVILTFESNSNLAPEFKASPPFGDSAYRLFFGSSEMDIAAGRVRFDWIDAEEINRDPD